MRVLVVGSGGREHALAWKVAQSPLLTELFCAPGNPGMEPLGTILPIRADDVAGLVRASRDHRIDLVVVGPEAPLVAGLVDRLAEAGIQAFGPSAAAAEVEGSKAFAKDVMNAASIPTAEHGTFDALTPALAFATARGGRVVVKADGLAAGKGVVVAGGIREAEEALRAMLIDRVHGGAGARVVVEERLEGPEVSVIALSDGERVCLLPPAQDHKRVGDGDAGPNTGGMGAYSPPPGAGPSLALEVERTVLLPALRELSRRGRPFRGALYAGLMLTPRGLRVLEFNARLGDPETQPLVMRLAGDLLPALLASARGDLSGVELVVDRRPAVGVVLAAEGYPAQPATGDAIEGADGPFEEGVQIFHAGTARGPGGKLVTAGGRVLSACAIGESLAAARERAYRALRRIRLRGGHYRSDIGLR